jgi:hypothetical protein
MSKPTVAAKLITKINEGLGSDFLETDYNRVHYGPAIQSPNTHQWFISSRPHIYSIYTATQIVRAPKARGIHFYSTKDGVLVSPLDDEPHGKYEGPPPQLAAKRESIG